MRKYCVQPVVGEHVHVEAVTVMYGNWVMFYGDETEAIIMFCAENVVYIRDVTDVEETQALVPSA